MCIAGWIAVAVVGAVYALTRAYEEKIPEDIRPRTWALESALLFGALGLQVGGCLDW